MHFPYFCLIDIFIYFSFNNAFRRQTTVFQSIWIHDADRRSRKLDQFPSGRCGPGRSNLTAVTASWLSWSPVVPTGPAFLALRRWTFGRWKECASLIFSFSQVRVVQRSIYFWNWRRSSCSCPWTSDFSAGETPASLVPVTKRLCGKKNGIVRTAHRFIRIRFHRADPYKAPHPIEMILTIIHRSETCNMKVSICIALRSGLHKKCTTFPDTPPWDPHRAKCYGNLLWSLTDWFFTSADKSLLFVLYFSRLWPAAEKHNLSWVKLKSEI